MPRTDGDSDCEVQCGPSSTTSGPGTGTEKKVPLGGQTLHERMAAIDTVEDFDEHIVQSYRGLSHPALCAQAFWLQAADWYVSIMMDCHFQGRIFAMVRGQKQPLRDATSQILPEGEC